MKQNEGETFHGQINITLAFRFVNRIILFSSMPPNWLCLQIIINLFPTK